MSADSNLEKSGARPKPPNAGKGRKAGSKNKVGTLVKEAVVKALDTVVIPVDKGGTGRPGAAAYLRWLAKEEPKAFATLVGKVMPTQITGEDGKAISIFVNGKDADLL